jgi:nucleotide-binding universal stress UspA family protein
MPVFLCWCCTDKNNTMKKILVPVTNDAASLNAARYAAHVAHHTGAVIVLFHVYEVPQPAIDIPLLPEELEDMRNEHQKILNQRTARMQSEFPSVQFHSCIMGDSVMLTDTVAHGITEAAATFSADLVVMGVHTGHKDGSFFGTSHVVPVIRQCSVPVLVIPPGAAFSGITNITLAFDFAFSAEKCKLDVLFQLADPGNCNITLLTVADDEEPVTVKQLVSAWQIEYKLRSIDHKQHIIYSDAIRDAIDEFVAHERPDLLVMIHHKRGMLERIFHPSSTESMTYRTPVPLLVLQG